jgi:hypothetical protein
MKNRDKSRKRAVLGMIYIALLYYFQNLKRIKNTKLCEDLRTISVSKQQYCIRLYDSKFVTTTGRSHETTKST